jgi:hypothetical protein
MIGDQGSHEGINLCEHGSLCLWGYQPAWLGVVVPMGELTSVNRGHFSYGGTEPAWPGVIISMGVSTCMTGGRCSYGGINLCQQGHFSYGGTEPAWPGTCMTGGPLFIRDTHCAWLIYSETHCVTCLSITHTHTHTHTHLNGDAHNVWLCWHFRAKPQNSS